MSPTLVLGGGELWEIFDRKIAVLLCVVELVLEAL